MTAQALIKKGRLEEAAAALQGEDDATMSVAVEAAAAAMDDESVAPATPAEIPVSLLPGEATRRAGSEGLRRMRRV